MGSHPNRSHPPGDRYLRVSFCRGFFKMNRIERPKFVQGETIKLTTGCGSLYVSVGYLDGRKPIEVFATMGKAGGCTTCQNEALTRSITLGLKYGIPLQEIIEELENLECPNKNMWPVEERVLSCADGIAKALRRFTDADSET